MQVALELIIGVGPWKSFGEWDTDVESYLDKRYPHGPRSLLVPIPPRMPAPMWKYENFFAGLALEYAGRGIPIIRGELCRPVVLDRLLARFSPRDTGEPYNSGNLSKIFEDPKLFEKPSKESEQYFTLFLFHNLMVDIWMAFDAAFFRNYEKGIATAVKRFQPQVAVANRRTAHYLHQIFPSADYAVTCPKSERPPHGCNDVIRPRGERIDEYLGRLEAK